MNLTDRLHAIEVDDLTRECERLRVSRDSLQHVVDHLRGELRDVVVDVRDRVKV
jgi:hypothetical protein